MQENSKFEEFALLVSFIGSTAGLDLRDPGRKRTATSDAASRQLLSKIHEKLVYLL